MKRTYESLEDRRLLDASTEMLGDLNASPVASEHAWLHDVVFFAAKDNTGDVELWQSDGTPEGTRRVRNVRAEGSSFPQQFIRSGDHVFFTAFDDVTGRELWRTDGTESGTIRLTDVFTGPGDGISAINELEDANGTLFFTGYSEVGVRMWKSDGTVLGTQPVSDQLISPGNDYVELASVGDVVYFWSATDRQVWMSDGSRPGTKRISEVWPNAPSVGYTGFIENANGILYFNVEREIWKLDDDGMEQVFGGSLQWPSAYGVVGNKLFFGVGQELWTTDGTEEGTIQLAVPEGIVVNFTPVGDRVFFQQIDRWQDLETASGELWVTDGTVGGTAKVPELEETVGAAVRGMIANADSLLVVSTTPSTGKEVFRIQENGVTAIELNAGPSDSDVAVLSATDEAVFFWDGDARGLLTSQLDSTQPIKLQRINDEISGPTASSFDTQSWDFTAFSVGGTVVFNTTLNDDGEETLFYRRGPEGISLIEALPPSSYEPKAAVQYRDAVFMSLRVDGVQEIWRTDGTEAGSYQVTSIGASRILNLTTVGSSLYFVAQFGDESFQLWHTDGTESGTHLVKPGFPRALELAEWQNDLYFAIRREETNELWTTDGTEAGTSKIADIDGRFLSYLVPTEHYLYAQVNHSGRNNNQIWRTDGLKEGTQLFTEGSSLTKHRDQLYFIRDNRLWTFNEVDANVQRVLELPAGIVLERVWTSGDRLFFITRNPEIQASHTAPNTTLWTSDGTQEGTIELTPINYGDHECSAIFFNFATLGEKTIFTFDGDGHGCELWQTDGTQSGTMRISDIAPGLTHGAPKYSSTTDGAVYFTADDGFHGREVYRLSLEQPLIGDANGDDTVDFADFLALSSNFGKTEGQTFADGDFDGDEDVDFSDFLLLSENFGKTAG